jgi:hypothetical protein
MAVRQDDQDTPPADGVGALQRTYAAWLEAGARLGFGVLVITFGAYVLDVWEPHVPIEHLPNLWALPVHVYLEKTLSPRGWGWLALLARSDYQTFLGVALLASVTIACFARILPALAARGERLYAWIAVAQIAVLVLAASGLVSGGH